MAIDHKADVAARDNNYPLIGGRLYRKNSTGCLVKQGNKEYSYPHSMCFGGLAAMIGADTQYIINGFQQQHPKFEDLDKETKVFFLSYLMNESPWSDCFLEKDAEWSVENNMTYHRIDRPGNMVMGCLSAVREMWEAYSMHGLPHFKQFVEAGCTKDFAWLLCQSMKVAESHIIIDDRMLGSGHSSWPVGWANVNHVINYLNHAPKGAHKQDFNYNYPYAGVFELFGKENSGKKFSIWLLDNSERTVNKKFNNVQPWESAGMYREKEIRLSPEDMAKEAAILCGKFYEGFKEQIK